MTVEVADRVRDLVTGPDSDVAGIGGTLAGNALTLAAIRATLADVLTPFHNMALMSPEAAEADVDHHTAVFAAAVGELVTP
jgi:hypothetical protein